MVEVKNLTKKYGSNVAVSDLTFTVESGRVYGLLGPNGAGKTTTMNIMTGCLSATEGQVIINGHDIFEDPLNAKKLIGYLPEIPPLYPDMTPYEYLSFVGAAKGLKGKALKEAIKKSSSVTGIDDVMKKLIKNLSKGYKQRVGIAEAIIGDPEIIILDEPTVGLDPVQIIEIRELIKSLGEEHTVILSSHILGEVSAVCDEILIISKGKLVASDTTENLLNIFKSENIVSVMAKGDADMIRSVLLGIDGAKDAEIVAAGTDGSFTFNVTSEKDIDLREKIFYAMKDKNISLISLNLQQSSLEDVFLKLTSDDIPLSLKERLKLTKNSIYKGGDNE